MKEDTGCRIQDSGLRIQVLFYGGERASQIVGGVLPHYSTIPIFRFFLATNFTPPGCTEAVLSRV